MKIRVFFSFFLLWCSVGTAQEPVGLGFDTLRLLNDLKWMSSDSLEGRGLGQPGSEMARQFIEERFESLGLMFFGASYRDTFAFANPFKKATDYGINLVGYIPGKKHQDEYIVVTAHYDHLGIRGGKIFNGADDNASGACGLLALAEHFMKYRPDYSIIFAAFDAEENGLIGSKHFVHQPPVALKKLHFNLNMDMVSRSDNNELFLCGTHHYPYLKPLFEDLNEGTYLHVLFGHDRGARRLEDWTHASDHGSFHKKKIPFIYLGVEDHQDYHKDTDDFERIDQHFYIEAIRVAARIVENVDQSKQLK